MSKVSQVREEEWDRKNIPSQNKNAQVMVVKEQSLKKEEERDEAGGVSFQGDEFCVWHMEYERPQ